MAPRSQAFNLSVELWCARCGTDRLLVVGYYLFITCASKSVRWPAMTLSGTVIIHSIGQWSIAKGGEGLRGRVGGACCCLYPHLNLLSVLV